MQLLEAITKRYSFNEVLEKAVFGACQNHINGNLGDVNSKLKLASTNDYEYWQQLSEVLLADQLVKNGFQPTHESEGPDFRIEQEGKRIWIEVITPEPSGIPEEWLNHITGTVFSFPHEAILLRWTSAIKEKAEKLLGYIDRKTNARIEGYIEKGIVSKEDAYVIAINSRLLRGFGGKFPEPLGISQFPFAVEATFCVGPLQIHIDRDTLKTTVSDHQHRSLISKPNGSSVPADTFLDPRYAPISAIWADDVDEYVLLGNTRPMVVVHNPRAKNPILRNFIPAQSEYVATENIDHYQLDRLDGRTYFDS